MQSHPKGVALVPTDLVYISGFPYIYKTIGTYRLELRMDKNM